MAPLSHARLDHFGARLAAVGHVQAGFADVKLPGILQKSLHSLVVSKGLETVLVFLGALMPQLNGIKAQIEMAPILVADAMALRDPEAARAGSRAPFLDCDVRGGDWRCDRGLQPRAGVFPNATRTFMTDAAQG